MDACRIRDRNGTCHRHLAARSPQRLGDLLSGPDDSADAFNFVEAAVGQVAIGGIVRLNGNPTADRIADCDDRLRDGIYVLRVDGALLVKRLASGMTSAQRRFDIGQGGVKSDICIGRGWHSLPTSSVNRSFLAKEVLNLREEFARRRLLTSK